MKKPFEIIRFSFFMPKKYLYNTDEFIFSHVKKNENTHTFLILLYLWAFFSKKII